jgi:hypothetical protein
MNRHPSLEKDKFPALNLLKDFCWSHHLPNGGDLGRSMPVLFPSADRDGRVIEVFSRRSRPISLIQAKDYDEDVWVGRRSS